MTNPYFRYVAFAIIFALTSYSLNAQTYCSLYKTSDSEQLNEVYIENDNGLEVLGHQGPAVENTHCALRILCDERGAIDVFSKSGRGMELELYGWNPDTSVISQLGVGADEYLEGETLGLGGVALWDNGQIVRLNATKGRLARVGESSKGAFAELIAYGVVYQGSTVDISIRVDVYKKTRIAKVTVKELSGKKVNFVTGVNYYDTQSVEFSDSHIAVWGKHPLKDGINPCSVGAGLFFSSKIFQAGPEKVDGMVRLISKPTSSITTKIITASAKEAELNTAKRFFAFMK